MNNKHVFVLFISGIICLTIHAMDNKKMLSRGALIAIEGIDGAGKSTLAQALFTELTQRGFDVIITREPGGTELGKEIRTIIQSPTTPIVTKAQYLLFAADRAQHFEECIIPALQQKKLIISDRLADSSVAYQGYGQGLDINIIKTINRWTMNGIKPDFTVFLDPTIELALERCSKRAELSPYENEEFLRKVKNGFREIYYNRNDVITDDSIDPLGESCSLFCTAIEEWLQENKFYS